MESSDGGERQGVQNTLTKQIHKGRRSYQALLILAKTQAIEKQTEVWDIEILFLRLPSSTGQAPLTLNARCVSVRFIGLFQTIERIYIMKSSIACTFSLLFSIVTSSWEPYPEDVDA